jgi:TonB-linked SusC/RagA family outer membrane protein
MKKAIDSIWFDKPNVNFHKLLLSLKIVTFILVCGLVLPSYAVSPGILSADDQQQIRVTGSITDGTTGTGMPGVNIVVKGTTTGAISDATGKYSLSVSDGNATLVFSFIGYVIQEVPLNGRTTLDVSLVSEMVGLNEVVVVGYGTVKRADLTGSVQSVNSEKLQNVSVTRVEQALVGKMAGVQIKPTSGQPGVSQQIRIRGIGSISASAEPLYVVDGFPISDIQTINPNDIETIDVLKDASATAIYGSRGSNGVIIISTKRGKDGLPVISFDSYYGWQVVEMTPKMMNSQELANHAYEGVKNRNLDAGNDVSGPPDKWKLAVPQDILDVLSGYNTLDVDWFDQIFHTAPQQQYQLSVRGGDKNMKYAISGEYLDQEGIIKNTNFQRYSIRANIDARVTKKLNVKVNLNPSFTNENLVTARGLTSGPNENVIGSAMAVTPLYPIYKENGEYFPYNGLTACGNFYHPIALVTDIMNTRKGMRLLGNINAEYKIYDDLSFNVLTGINLQGSDQQKFKPKTDAFLGDPAYGQNDNTQVYNWLMEYTLNYNKIIGKHVITGLLGYTSQKENYKSVYIYSDKYPNNLVPYLSAVSGQITNGNTSFSEWSMVSYLARINYNYNGKYYLTASFRTDGSSRFGADKKYGQFPSAAVAWRISDEEFMKGISQLSELKLRGSYGVTGNNNIGNYDHLATIAYDSYTLGGAAIGGYAPARFANPILTWETQEQFDIGVDISFFKRRLNLTIDNFRSKNTNLLLNVNVPDVSGFSTALKNIGEVQNKGWEFVLGTVNTTGRFEWTTDFNISTYKNEVTKLGPSGDPIINTTNITMIGQPIGMFYGWLTNGIFKNQEELNAGPLFGKGTAAVSHMGDVRFVDVSGPNGTPDGEITSLDKTIMGNPYPDFYYGMTNNFTFKNFTFTISIQGSQGADILMTTWPGSNRNTRYRTNNLAIGNNYWKSPEEPGDGITPRPNDAPTGNNRGEFYQAQLASGSYMRVNNMSLSYVLPSSVSNKLKVSSVRMYVNSNNPFIFTDYPSFNPESSTSGNSLTPGLDNNDYPLAKTFTVGLNLTF